MLDLHVRDVPLVFLDTETTGLEPRSGDRIVEIALARFRGGVMEDCYEQLLYPDGRPISPGAARVNRIRDRELRGKPRFADIIPDLRARLAGTLVVAHNAPFDLGFLANEFRLACESCPDNLVLDKVLDTLALLRRHFNFSSNSLATVAASLGIQTPHRALGDALATQQVLTFILNRLAPGGSCTVAELLRLQSGTIPWRASPRAEIVLPPEWQAVRQRNCRIYICYEDNSGARTERSVSPIDFRLEGGYIILRAFCHLRNDERSFRLDRILKMRLEE